MAASETKKRRKKKLLPKPRLPVPPPGTPHKSKKDYKREKKVKEDV